jgi:hypothetical protein
MPIKAVNIHDPSDVEFFDSLPSNATLVSMGDKKYVVSKPGISPQQLSADISSALTYERDFGRPSAAQSRVRGLSDDELDYALETPTERLASADDFDRMLAALDADDRLEEQGEASRRLAHRLNVLHLTLRSAGYGWLVSRCFAAIEGGADLKTIEGLNGEFDMAMQGLAAIRNGFA